MIEPIVHHPFNFALGPLKLTGFGIAMMAAFGIAHTVAQTVLRQRGDDDEIMNDVTFAALVGTIVGGKVYFAINETFAGRAFTDAADHTCSNWTSNAATGIAQLGHSDKQGGGNGSWNAAHPSRGCGQQNLVATGGAGLLYCFAVN